MVKADYCPERGDLIWLHFIPQAGREQAGRRPALVLTKRSYNQKARLALVCPVTSKIKGYPFEVVLPEGLAASGAVLSDHVRSVDWESRRAAFIDKAPEDLVAEVLDGIGLLLE
ncbi:MAG: type II toxin-antitoxin system PemK/MazF family toxin [Nitrososphaera sp.]